jgi:pimeloyl-ACP methyl ester carboxylesterase
MVASPQRRTDSPATHPAGSAASLFFVHGFGCSRIVWNAVTEHLRDDYRNVLVDLPGHRVEAFNTYCRERHATLSGMAKAVEDMLPPYASISPRSWWAIPSAAISPGAWLSRVRSVLRSLS